MTITQINTAAQPSVIAPKPKNALVHGVYATDITLPWESGDDLEQLHQDLRKEWDPQGATEEETVLSLCRYIWLKRRVMRSAQFTARKDPVVLEFEKLAAGTKTKTWEEVESLQRDHAISNQGLIADVKKTVEALRISAEKGESMLSVSNPEMSAIHHQVVSTRTFIEKILLPNLIDFKKKYIGNASIAIEQSYNPDYLDKITRLEALLDARIDKILQRLVSTKEFKRIIQATQPQPVANSSIAPPVLEAKINKS
jgi:hypothetical protein